MRRAALLAVVGGSAPRSLGGGSLASGHYRHHAPYGRVQQPHHGHSGCHGGALRITRSLWMPLQSRVLSQQGRSSPEVAPKLVALEPRSPQAISPRSKKVIRNTIPSDSKKVIGPTIPRNGANV